MLIWAGPLGVGRCAEQSLGPLGHFDEGRLGEGLAEVPAAVKAPQVMEQHRQEGFVVSEPGTL